jgi:hypothetical protein
MDAVGAGDAFAAVGGAKVVVAFTAVAWAAPTVALSGMMALALSGMMALALPGMMALALSGMMALALSGMMALALSVMMALALPFSLSVRVRMLGAGRPVGRPVGVAARRVALRVGVVRNPRQPGPFVAVGLEARMARERLGVAVWR